MPIHLPPISRRELLAQSISASAGLTALSLSPRSLFAEEGSENRDTANWLLWSDPHIDKNRERDNKGTGFYMYKNFITATKEVIERKKGAAGIFINGDCANQYGLRPDYTVLAELLKPLSKAGFPIHMTMGNHDHRGRFLDVLKERLPNNQPRVGRRIGVVEAKDANWFLLDTLKTVNGTPGEMGKKQLAWLKEELDKRAKKPAIIMLHHNPKTGKVADKKFDGWGLIDTDGLFALAKPRKHVKAMIFGHTHHWGVDQIDNIHLINLPALGRIFQKEEPLGWVDATLRPDGMKIELRALDTTHKAHGETHNLKWRV